MSSIDLYCKRTRKKKCFFEFWHFSQFTPVRLPTCTFRIVLVPHAPTSAGSSALWCRCQGIVSNIARCFARFRDGSVPWTHAIDWNCRTPPLCRLRNLRCLLFWDGEVKKEREFGQLKLKQKKAARRIFNPTNYSIDVFVIVAGQHGICCWI